MKTLKFEGKNVEKHLKDFVGIAIQPGLLGLEISGFILAQNFLDMLDQHIIRIRILLQVLPFQVTKWVIEIEEMKSVLRSEVAVRQPGVLKSFKIQSIAILTYNNQNCGP